MYEYVKFIHVASAFAFILAHGASGAVALGLRRERDPIRVAALLDLSRAALGPVTWIAALVMLLSGVLLGFQGDWWGRWWIWLSIVTLVVLMGAMTPMGAIRLNRIREALGIQVDRKRQAPVAATPSELAALLERWDPRPLTGVGLGGLLVIIALMTLKPF